MGVAYRVLTPEPTLEEIQAIRENPRMRLTATQFGLTREQVEKGMYRVFTSDAVPWKGREGTEFIKFAKERDDALLAANELARKISKAYTGVKGTGYDPKTGKYMPKKAFSQRRWAEEHPELKEAYERWVKPKAKKYKPKPELPYEVIVI